MNSREQEILMDAAQQLNKWSSLSKMYILDPVRAMLLEETCDKLQLLLDEEQHECHVEVAPCPLGLGDVVISFDTYSMTMRNMAGFCDAIKHLSNFEIYPTDDDMLHFVGIFPKVAVVYPLQEQ